MRAGRGLCLAAAALLLVLGAGPPRARPDGARAAATRESGGAASSGSEELAAAKDRLLKDGDELKSALGRLSALSAEYSGARDIDGLARSREHVRAEASAALTRFKDDLKAFKELRKEHHIRQQAALISAVLDRGRKSGVRADFEEMLALEKVIQDMDPQAVYAAQVLDQDLAAFAAARARRGTLRRAGAIGAAACLVLGVFLVVLFRADRPLPEAAREVVWPPAETGGAPPQGLLKGPAPTPPPRTALPAVTAGAVLGGGFRVGRTLGVGSLGPVYEAVEVSTGRKVVVKRLRDEFHRREKEIDRLLAQARRVAELRHPSLAEVLSVFIESDRVHLAIERVEGQPLSEPLRASGRLSLPVVKHVVWQVSDVLDYAHRQGVMHGDLRPSNVFLLKDNVVKVLDFGVGLEARKMAAKLSWTEPVAGLAYMAPEQELGSDLKESDVYSLGALMYEMLTGRLPFEGPDLLAKKRAMRYDAPGRLARLPREIDAAVERALQADPAKRFPTAGDLFEAVDAAPEIS